MQLENPERFLTDSGLLFHINRHVLHPLGLSMVLDVAEEGGSVLSSRIEIHETDTPVGFTFSEEDMSRWSKVADEFISTRKSRVLTRRQQLGYLTQPLSTE